MKEVAERFKCIFSKNLGKMTEDQLYASAVFLYIKHPEDLSSDFPRQLILFRSILKQEISVIGHYSVIELYDVLVKKHTVLCYNILDVLLAIKLFLVLPVTGTSAERSFSKLKSIKSYV